MARQCSEEAQEHTLLIVSNEDNEGVSINGDQVQRINCGRFRSIKVRAVFLALLWTLAVSVSGSWFGNINLHFKYVAPHFKYLDNVHASGILNMAILAFAAPLAGWLADTKLGRHRVIQFSLWSMWIGIGGLILVDTYIRNTMTKEILKPLCKVPISCGYSAFMATIIQFAIDQMPAASSEEVSAFNHWFVWVYYFGNALSNILIQLSSCNKLFVSSTGSTFILLFMLAMLTLGLSIGMLFQDTLMLIPESRNPMKLVIRVLRYSATHKYPENRRAHTYTDSCNPSRFDLGKEIYGGPFTTEQVEDVKTFLRIISIILTTIALEISIDLCRWPVPNLIDHFQSFSRESQCIRIASGLAYSKQVIIVISIPLYELFIYPLAWRWVPKILHKILIAIILNVFICLFLLILTSAGHFMRDLPCIIFTSLQENNMALLINYLAIGIPIQILKALTDMFYWIGLYEFICAQSPYNMKGFLLGLYSFAIYFGDGIATFIQAWWYYGWNDQHTITTPSCDFWYYLMVTIIAVLALVLVVLVVRRYQQRERDEPNYNRIHAENYYEQHISHSSLVN